MMENKKNIKRSLFGGKGFAALYVAIIVLAIMAGIALTLTFLVVNQEKILSNSLTSYQSFSVAEAGIEDALLRLSKNKKWSSPYNLSLGGGTSNVEISNIIGGTRTITSTGNFNNRIRKVRVVYQISSKQISFYYGAQVGDSGMVMGNNSQVQGNVFSNGSITGGNGANITNSIIIAGNGNKLQNVDVGGDADVHTCADSNIAGTLYYVSGGSIGNCTFLPAGSYEDRGPNEIEDIPLPISQSEIDGWKAAATAGGVIGNKTISGIESLGPVEIAGNLKVNGGATLRVTGTIYVTGNIIFDTNSRVQLDSSYGSLSGVIIAGALGTITVENGTQISGSGQPGSYVLILSEMNDTDNPVINVRNNALGDTVFYANNGLIYLKNGMRAREVTAKKIQIENTAIIQYESGLENANFSNGPGGSWEVASWKEIE